MADTLRNILKSKLEGALYLYNKDLDALSHDDLYKAYGGATRRPADFTYEVGFVNRRVATSLRGEDPGKWPYETWVTAGDEAQDKAGLSAYFTQTTQELIDALGNLSDEELTGERLIDGENKPLVDSVYLALNHMFYHSGQLNYVQSLNGDGEFHWA